VMGIEQKVGLLITKPSLQLVVGATEGRVFIAWQIGTSLKC
jgi:hypothetical protein